MRGAIPYKARTLKVAMENCNRAGRESKGLDITMSHCFLFE